VTLTCCGQGSSSTGETPPVEPAPSGIVSSPSNPTSGPVTLEAKFSNVLFRPQGAQETPVPQGDIRHASTGDAVTVNNQGEAWLDFPQALTVRVYENSGVTYEGLVNPNASAAERLRLETGAIFGTNAQQAATKHVSIETQWAVITDIGTQFLVYYDQQTQLTWVVVVDGKVEVAATTGQRTSVPAGWQSWVLPNRPPAPPIPASRGVIGRRFPLIEDITGRRLAEVDVLTSHQCTVVNVQPNDSLNVRTQPNPQSDTNIIDTMVNGARFEAIGRLPDASWIYGVSPNGLRGWARADQYLQCALDVQLLTTDIQTLLDDPMMQVTPVPNTPTDTPTAPPTDTPTPTETPTPLPLSPPRFDGDLQYDPAQVYYLECGNSNPVNFAAVVTDLDGITSVMMTYHFASAQRANVSAGPERHVEMAGQQPKYSVTIDVGKEAFGGANTIIYEVVATDKLGSQASLQGKIAVRSGPC
jgi:hypothetical protein